MRNHGIIFLAALAAALVGGQLAAVEPMLAKQATEAIGRAGDNAQQLRTALALVPDQEREGMLFLIANMPDRDLRELAADFLLENVKFAYKAWSDSPWRDSVPKDIFLNDILPYANLNERRDNWRADFYEKFKPLIADCKTPSEAAVKLNQEIFKIYGVIFSRQRPKADQSPYETIEAGLASCSGLSILFVDACRAVAVPARLAGIPVWPDRSGNHSWAEVWDGRWHYTGAAEPNGDLLDTAWFTDKARTAIAGHPLHSIRAISFRKTDLYFPLPWDRTARYVSSVDVTDRYTAVPSENTASASSESAAAPLDVEASMHALRQLQEYVGGGDRDWGKLPSEKFADVPLTASDAGRAALILWGDYVARAKAERADEMEARRIGGDGLEMPFFYSVNGEKPEQGRSLFISLHGGGGAPKAVNDQQWENQKRLYKIEEGVYIAPRAPNDAWNMWFQGHIDGMFDRLIQNMILFEDVNPNRVYLMGYSAGGDGLYRMGPRMADRWAAAAMMAGHPGDASPINLYNTPYTIHAGAFDSAYNRNEQARKWGERLDKLAAENPGGYPHWTKIYEGRGHWVDNGAAEAIPWMREHTRDPFPKTVVWRQDKHPRFYWLAVDEVVGGRQVRAQLKGQRIELASDVAIDLRIRLNDKMLDLDREVVVAANGQIVFNGIPRRTIATIARTIRERGDPSSIFSAEIPAAAGNVEQ